MVKKNAFSFFLGCIMPNRYPQIESATHYVMEKLGYELIAMEQTTCCPAPGVFRSFDKLDWMIVAARNICIAEKNDADILTVCNGCFGTLLDVNKHLKENPEDAKKVNEKLKDLGDYEWKGTVRVRHIAEFISLELGVSTLVPHVTRHVNATAVVHYGCHLIKPGRIRQLSSTENPIFLDEFVEFLGVRSLDFRKKLTCCGAGGGVLGSRRDTSMLILREKLIQMDEVHPDFIFDTCPFCQLQFDAGQTTINEKYGKEFDIPVIHMSQLLAYCMGMEMDAVGMRFQAHGKEFQFQPVALED
ncbi:MAG: CoB--CoM heterodisulfide reductase subunit B [Promethearchaeota archaeon]